MMDQDVDARRRAWADAATPEEREAFRLGFNYALDVEREARRTGWTVGPMGPGRPMPWSTAVMLDLAYGEHEQRGRVAEARADMALYPANGRHYAAARRRLVNAERVLRESYDVSV